MNNSTTILKQCCRKENCVHPKQMDDGWLPATPEYFHKNKRSKDGFVVWCKSCRAIYTQEYNDKNREIIKQKNNKAYKENPEKFRERMRKTRQSDPEKAKNIAKKWRENHPELNRERVKDAWLKNPDKYRRGIKFWKQKHPEKMREYGRIHNRKRRTWIEGNEGIHTTEDINQQYAKQQGKCYWCGIKVKKHFEIDHIVPISRGGSNDPSNLAIACSYCNRSKGDKLPEEWLGKGFKIVFLLFRLLYLGFD